MKRFFTLLLFIAVSFFTLNAQQGITITANDMPNTGDIYLFDQATPPVQFNASATGAAYTWDYSNLQPINNQSDTFLAVLQTPLFYNFVFNNFLDPERATIATNLTLLPSFGPLPLPITTSNEFTYYREESGVYKEVGFAFTANYNSTDIPLPIKYDPVDVIYNFPLNYGSTQSPSTSRYQIEIPSLFTYIENRNRVNTVDGYGTLKLPNMDLETVRVKSELTLKDSLFVDSLGFWFPLQPRTEVEYKWLAQGYGEPVLEIRGQQVTFPFNAYQPNSLKYRHFNPVAPTAVWEDAAKIAIKAYPLPATDAIKIEAESIEEVVLRSIDGKEILRKPAFNNENSNFTLNFGNSKPALGLYILQVKTKKGLAVLKIPIE